MTVFTRRSAEAGHLSGGDVVLGVSSHELGGERQEQTILGANPSVALA